MDKLSAVQRTSPKAIESQALEETSSGSKEENAPNWNWLKCKAWQMNQLVGFGHLIILTNPVITQKEDFKMTRLTH